MSGNTGYVNTTNLLVPPNAATHCVRTTIIASATPQVLNFGQFSVDNFPFNPQAAYFDNTANDAALVVTVIGLAFTLTIPAGALTAANFPAPQDIEFSITGAGTVNIFWVDYPLIFSPPGANSGATVSIANQPVSVAVVSGAVTVSGSDPIDKSVVTVSDVSTMLLAANATRKSLLIQAPQSTGVWLNFAGGAAGVGLSGCIFLPAGAIYESSIVVNLNEITYYCATAGLTIAVLEG
jgi:hypothetical protein